MPNAPLRLIGIKITLRDWQLPDLDRWSSWLSPGQRWKDLDGPYYPLPEVDEIARMLRKKRAMIEERAFPDPRSDLVIADGDTDAFLGLVSRHWESEETHWPGVGIVLFDPATWGLGRGFEALGLWSDYLFAALPQIVRLDLRTWSGNRGMMRLAEKLGYTQEARFRKARIVHGVYHDGLGYGVLREEWQARYPRGFAASLRGTP